MASGFTLDGGHELGSGGYGKVVTARNNSTGETVAAKLISTSRMKMAAIEKEIELSTCRARSNAFALFWPAFFRRSLTRLSIRCAPQWAA